VDQLRQQYEQRLQDALQQKTKWFRNCKAPVNVSRQNVRAAANRLKKDGESFDTQAIETEISRVEGLLNEIVSIIENPSTELSIVIRKNVGKSRTGFLSTRYLVHARQESIL
jgi:hypothetical protein